MKFYPYRKGGWGRTDKVVTMLKGGTRGFWVVLTQELNVLAFPIL